MTLHETRDCVIFGLRNQIWKNIEAKKLLVFDDVGYKNLLSTVQALEGKLSPAF